MAMPRFLAPFGASRSPARWGDPFVDLQREVNRVFDDVFRGFGVAPSGEDGSAVVAPRIDIDESAGAIQISVELPGVPPEGIEVSVEDDVLTIRGEKRCERKDEKARVSERYYGKFQRAVQLPFPPDPDQIQASFEHGVLKIALPKREPSRETQRIPVQTSAPRSIRGLNGGPEAGAENGASSLDPTANAATKAPSGQTGLP
jgi:HSP20 family protein